jgi:hypothetical protein
MALFMHIIFCILFSESSPRKTLCWSILSSKALNFFFILYNLKSVCMRKLYLMLIPAIWIFAGCSKSGKEGDDAAQKRADEFHASIKGHKYKPVSFYSDKPIDYITNDNEVKSETDLWIYVKEYIKDDENVFNSDASVTVHQNANKMPGNNAATFNLAYGVEVSGPDVMFKFVDYNYVAAQYKLSEFDNAYFTVYVDGPAGSKLYSKFARVE